jgi:type II secretory pathway predicted ATPase ExeA
MYEKHFRLARKPFAATADSPAYYPATTHETAVKMLREAIGSHEGFAALTGPAGSGKTLIAHRLLEDLSSSFGVIWVSNTHLRRPADLFQALLFDLELPLHSVGEQELRLRFIEHVLQLYQSGRGTVVVLDEAHLLAPRLLEELRLLGNLEAGLEKAFQVVLIGQPALADSLALPALYGLRQRIASHPTLVALDIHEGVDYLRHHLRSAGAQPDRITTEEALEIIADGAKGIPRVLNQAMHRAMSLACSAGQTTVDAEAALEALAELGIDTGAPENIERQFDEADTEVEEENVIVSIKQRVAAADAPPAVRTAPKRLA